MVKLSHFFRTNWSNARSNCPASRKIWPRTMWPPKYTPRLDNGHTGSLEYCISFVRLQLAFDCTLRLRYVMIRKWVTIYLVKWVVRWLVTVIEACTNEEVNWNGRAGGHHLCHTQTLTQREREREREMICCRHMQHHIHIKHTKINDFVRQNQAACKQAHPSWCIYWTMCGSLPKYITKIKLTKNKQ